MISIERLAEYCRAYDEIMGIWPENKWEGEEVLRFILECEGRIFDLDGSTYMPEFDEFGSPTGCREEQTGEYESCSECAYAVVKCPAWEGRL